MVQIMPGSWPSMPVLASEMDAVFWTPEARDTLDRRSWEIFMSTMIELSST